jgi:hypothetical protein
VQRALKLLRGWVPVVLTRVDDVRQVMHGYRISDGEVNHSQKERERRSAIRRRHCWADVWPHSRGSAWRPRKRLACGWLTTIFKMKLVVPDAYEPS